MSYTTHYNKLPHPPQKINKITKTRDNIRDKDRVDEIVFGNRCVCCLPRSQNWVVVTTVQNNMFTHFYFESKIVTGQHREPGNDPLNDLVILKITSNRKKKDIGITRSRNFVNSLVKIRCYVFFKIIFFLIGGLQKESMCYQALKGGNIYIVEVKDRTSDSHTIISKPIVVAHSNKWQNKGN